MPRLTTPFRVSAFILLVLFGLTRLAGAADSFTPEQLEFFEKHVRPVFIEHCQKCHGGTQQKGGLKLDSRAAILQGGDTGPAIVESKPAESELIKAISYDPDGYQMPPTGKLPAETIAKLTEWVQMGAPWPKEAPVADKLAPASKEEFARRSQYWSFRPLNRVAPPTVKNLDWPRTTIDRFVLSRLESSGLPPAAETDRRTWLRRVTFDVIGLPPTRDEVAAFLADESPDAFEKVVDRLLVSPHYGERWGRHWLDLARYAESRGHEFDYDVANPWHYRDYVIRAMNEDVPYDQFVVEQVAGDLLRSPYRPEHQHGRYEARLHPLTGANESLVGTGFWLLGEWVHSPVDIRKEEAERFDNMLDVYGKTFLGLTIACARCHDHKFDPISQEDYYALSGFLKSSIYAQRPFDTLEQNQRIQRELVILSRTAQPKLTAKTLELASGVTSKLDRYLTAAREAAAASAQVNASNEPSPAAAIAEREGLDASILAAWVSHLSKEASDPSDPFYLWTRLATGKATPAAAMEEAVRLTPRAMGSQDPVVLPPEDQQPKLLATDGVAISVPTPGDVEPVRIDLSDKAEQPIAGAWSSSLARISPEFESAGSDGPIMGEPGAIGKIRRGGRTLATSSFLIGADRIYCRVRGACNTYLAVDSHITLNGPLHGGLYREHKPEPGWRWIEHDLSRYKGHHAHLELIVPPGADFACGEVYQGDRPPWTGPLEPNSAAAIVDRAVTTSEGDLPRLTAEIRTLFSQTSDQPALLDWIVRRPQLFGLSSETARTALRDASAPFLETRATLVSQIRKGNVLAPCLLDGSAEDEAVAVRGNPGKTGKVVPRRFLSVFQGGAPAADETGSGRLDLAMRMVDPVQTPVLSRVIVNRIWLHAFGRGLVPTVDDFGHMGQAPSHPQLLDWLATELIRNDWSLKAIQRQVLLSSTYRMQSVDRPELASNAELANLDPQNMLLHRMNVKRLEAELVRDSVLAGSGRLNDQIYGPSTPIHLTEFLEGRGRPGASGPIDGQGRRSLYLSVRRNFLEPFMVAFDFPTPHTSIGRRSVSNVPAQALALMNNPLVREQSAVWARRLLSETPQTSTDERITRLYETAFGRLPNDAERAAAREFVSASPEDPQTWTDLCHVLINVKEFIFIR
jgi:hypothetical protein